MKRMKSLDPLRAKKNIHKNTKENVPDCTVLDNNVMMFMTYARCGFLIQKFARKSH